MKIVARQGDEIYLVQVSETHARVLSLVVKRMFPSMLIDSILARGNWEFYEGTDKELRLLRARVVEMPEDYYGAQAERVRISIGRQWTEFLQGEPEAGQGYHRVDVTFADGRTLPGVVVTNGEYMEVPDEFSDLGISDMQVSDAP